MKKLFICAIIFLAGGMISQASAQLRPSSNTDIQPSWGPSGHQYVQYYYLPEISTYYYVPRKQFIYQSDGYWTFSSSLPASLKKFDLRNAEKIVMNEPGAYRYYAQHKEKYSSKNGAVAVD